MPPSGIAPERRPPRAAIGLLLAGLAVFGLLAVLVLLAEPALLAIDRPLSEALRADRGDALAEVMRGISLLGSRAVIGGILLALTLWAIVTRECQRTVGIVLVVFAVAMVLEWTLKAGIGRLRPEEAFALTRVTTAAFPSGHALGSAAVYAILAVALGGGARGHALVWLLIAAIGVSRVVLGVHWPSDVLGGIALGAAIAAAGVLALRGHRLDPNRCPAGHGT